MTRLEAVCSLIEPAGTIADVGCDHGRLAEYCVNAGLAERVIASDISEMCLQKAKKRLSGRQNVMFVCCDGIKYDCDEAVIAGMGGCLICDILFAADFRPKTLVLCPHRDASAVRRALEPLGYGIDRDFMVCERGRFYSVMRARQSGGERGLSELKLLFGTGVDVPDATLKNYLLKLYSTYAPHAQRNRDKLEPIIAALKLQGEDSPQFKK